jgi:hypothetical protein
MTAGEGFPEQDADGPDIRRRAGVLPPEPLRRDVRQRAGHVAGCGEGVGFVEEGEPEVEQADRDTLLVGEQHVRRLDVAVHDPARVRVCEAFEDLGRRLDRLPFVQAPIPQRLPQGAAGDVLICDVHVPVVRGERPRP